MNNRTHMIRNACSTPRTPLLLALAVLLAAGGCKKSDEPTGRSADQPAAADKADAHHDRVTLDADAVAKYGIQVEPVNRQTLTPTIVAPARVSYDLEAMAHVGAVLRGRVVELKARKGDAVKRGQALIVVESPELGEAQSDYLQKQTGLAVAGPAVEFAKSAYDRAKGLYEGSKGITITELQKREADYKAAQGALQSAQSALTAAENKLHLLGMTQEAVEALTKSKEIRPRYTITAPIDGQVTEREVTLGELVNPEKEALLVIADLTKLWVLADVPEARLRQIAVGSPARVSVSAVGSGRPLQGKVSLIDPALDPNTRSARVRIDLPNPNGDIRPGMFAQAEIAAGAKAAPAQPVLAIPDEAVQTVDGAAAVFVPVNGTQNTFAKRPVTVGKAVGGLVPVLAGLKEGEQVVTNGSFVLKADLGKGATDEE